MGRFSHAAANRNDQVSDYLSQSVERGRDGQLWECIYTVARIYRFSGFSFLCVDGGGGRCDASEGPTPGKAISNSWLSIRSISLRGNRSVVRARSRLPRTGHFRNWIFDRPDRNPDLLLMAKAGPDLSVLALCDASGLPDRHAVRRRAVGFRLTFWSGPTRRRSTRATTWTGSRSPSWPVFGPATHLVVHCSQLLLLLGA